MSDRELIQQLRDACFAMQMEARARNCGLRICDDAIAAADARLAQPEWTRVEDALPDVLVDHEDVDVYTFDGVTVDDASFVSSEAWTGFTSDCRGTPVSHWQYRIREKVKTITVEMPMPNSCGRLSEGRFALWASFNNNEKRDAALSAIKKAIKKAMEQT